jgi:hypothetical protein
MLDNQEQMVLVAAVAALLAVATALLLLDMQQIKE